MKTITFKGTEEQLYNLQDVYEQCDKTKLKEVETRVYVVDTEKYQYEPNMSDEDFIILAEHEARGYNLREFQFAFNYGDINTLTDVIRFINVPV